MANMGNAVMAGTGFLWDNPENYKPCRKKLYEIHACKPPLGTYVINKLEQSELYRQLGRAYFTVQDLQRRPDVAQKMDALAQKGLIYKTTQGNEFVLCGTRGEMWVIGAGKLAQRYDMVRGNDVLPINAESMKKAMSYNKSIPGVVPWFRVRTKPNASSAFACFVPAGQQFQVATSWGTILNGNVGSGHGKGDFVIAADAGGKPNLGSRYIVNGLVFKDTYNNQGWTDHLAAEKTENTGIPEDKLPKLWSEKINLSAAASEEDKKTCLGIFALMTKALNNESSVDGIKAMCHGGSGVTRETLLSSLYSRTYAGLQDIPRAFKEFAMQPDHFMQICLEQVKAGQQDFAQLAQIIENVFALMLIDASMIENMKPELDKRLTAARNAASKGKAEPEAQYGVLAEGVVFSPSGIIKITNTQDNLSIKISVPGENAQAVRSATLTLKEVLMAVLSLKSGRDVYRLLQTKFSSVHTVTTYALTRYKMTKEQCERLYFNSVRYLAYVLSDVDLLEDDSEILHKLKNTPISQMTFHDTIMIRGDNDNKVALYTGLAIKNNKPEFTLKGATQGRKADLHIDLSEGYDGIDSAMAAEIVVQVASLLKLNILRFLLTKPCLDPVVCKVMSLVFFDGLDMHLEKSPCPYRVVNWSDDNSLATLELKLNKEVVAIQFESSDPLILYEESVDYCIGAYCNGKEIEPVSVSVHGNPIGLLIRKALEEAVDMKAICQGSDKLTALYASHYFALISKELSEAGANITPEKSNALNQMYSNNGLQLLIQTKPYEGKDKYRVLSYKVSLSDGTQTIDEEQGGLDGDDFKYLSNMKVDSMLKTLTEYKGITTPDQMLDALVKTFNDCVCEASSLQDIQSHYPHVKAAVNGNALSVTLDFSSGDKTYNFEPSAKGYYEMRLQVERYANYQSYMRAH